MSVIEFLKRFFKPSYTLLPEEEKEFSESEILLYAKKRVADVFHLPEDEVALGDVFCQGRLQIHPSPFFNSSELDILNDDLCNAAWDDDQDTVWIKMHGEDRPMEFYEVRDYCEYMVCCYRYCTKRSYKEIIAVLGLKPKKES